MKASTGLAFEAQEHLIRCILYIFTDLWGRDGWGGKKTREEGLRVKGTVGFIPFL